MIMGKHMTKNCIIGAVLFLLTNSNLKQVTLLRKGKYDGINNTICNLGQGSTEA